MIILNIEGALIDHFLEGIAPLRKLLYLKSPEFMSWLRSTLNEVNDLALKL